MVLFLSLDPKLKISSEKYLTEQLEPNYKQQRWDQLTLTTRSNWPLRHWSQLWASFINLYSSLHTEDRFTTYYQDALCTHTRMYRDRRSILKTNWELKVTHAYVFKYTLELIPTWSLIRLVSMKLATHATHFVRLRWGKMGRSTARTHDTIHRLICSLVAYSQSIPLDSAMCR